MAGRPAFRLNARPESPAETPRAAPPPPPSVRVRRPASPDPCPATRPGSVPSASGTATAARPTRCGPASRGSRRGCSASPGSSAPAEAPRRRRTAFGWPRRCRRTAPALRRPSYQPPPGFSPRPSYHGNLPPPPPPPSPPLLRWTFRSRSGYVLEVSLPGIYARVLRVVAIVIAVVIIGRQLIAGLPDPRVAHLLLILRAAGAALLIALGLSCS